MTLREQMDAAWSVYSQDVRYAQPPERFAFEAGFRAALSLIANPSDEMVERCAEGMRLAPDTADVNELVRECLKAAGGA